MQVNWKAVITSVVTFMVLALMGGVWDFQNIKAGVNANSESIKSLESEQKKIRELIRAIGIITCMEALKKDMPQEAKETCLKVLK